MKRKIRLGLYDPDPDKNGVHFVGRIFGADEHDVVQLAIARYNKLSRQRGIRLCLGAFPIDAAGELIESEVSP